MTRSTLTIFVYMILSFFPAVGFAIDLSGCDREELKLLLKAGFTKAEIADHCRPSHQPSGNPGTEGHDISGTWVFGDGGETWTFTSTGGNTYKAQENGYGNAYGTATVTGSGFHIDFECPNRRCKGTYTGTIGVNGDIIKATRSDGRKFVFSR